MTSMCGSVESVWSGDHHVVAQLADGSLRTWGMGDIGQLGRTVPPIKVDGETQAAAVNATHVVPKPPLRADGAALTGVRAAGCGGYHTFVVVGEGAATCVLAAGLNNYGQLGLPHAKDAKRFAEVNGLVEVPALRGQNVKQVSARARARVLGGSGRLIRHSRRFAAASTTLWRCWRMAPCSHSGAVTRGS